MTKIRALVSSVLLLVAAAGLAAQRPSNTRETLVFIGTYTGEKSKGIYVSRMNTETGEMSPPQLAAEAKSPSFLAVYPARNLLYSVNEVNTSDGRPTGTVPGRKNDSFFHLGK